MKRKEKGGERKRVLKKRKRGKVATFYIAHTLC
jgi:hypothetical protein